MYEHIGKCAGALGVALIAVNLGTATRRRLFH